MKKIFQTFNLGNIFPKDPKRRKKIYTFSSFVLLSILIWLIIKLSQDNEARFDLYVNIENTPTEFIIKDLSNNKFAVDIRTVGTRLLYIKMIRHTGEVYFDFSDFSMIEKKGNIYYFITGRQLMLNLPQFLQHSDSEIISVKPDTLFLEVRIAEKKDVPIVFKGTMDFSARYRQYGEIQLKPDHITIAGPAEQLRRIDTLYTRETHLSGLDKPLEKTLEVLRPLHSGAVTLAENQVRVFVDVREYTESKVDVGLKVDCPDDYKDQVDKIRLFPSRATIYYLVALEDYGKITDDMFLLKTECPFEKEGANRLNINVTKKPENVEIIRVEPPRTEYILLR